MIRLVAWWHLPAGADVDAVDKHYFEVHVPGVRKVPGLARHVVAKSLPFAEGTQPSCYRVAEIWFDTQEDFETAMTSPEWQAVTEDGYDALIGGLQSILFTVEDEWTAGS
jgi:uncharacterized protein (TIGR02118 family)